MHNNLHKNIWERLTINKTLDITLNSKRIVLSEKFKNMVIKLAKAGHVGLTKIKAFLRSKAIRPNILLNNVQFAKFKPSQYYQQKVPSLQPLKKSAKWSSMFNCNGWPTIKVPSCGSATKYINLINNFLQRTITTFSMPQTTISDNSLPFQLYHVKDLFTRLKIKH